MGALNQFNIYLYQFCTCRTGRMCSNRLAVLLNKIVHTFRPTCLALCSSETKFTGEIHDSEFEWVCGGPLAYHYANLVSHTAFRHSLACVSLLFQHSELVPCCDNPPVV
jgi:hypothetical protein